MDLWALLSDIVIILAAALLLGGVFSRFGQSPLIGYLLAGMFLGGPGSIELVKSGQELEAIAELGVSLLLFSLGLEFSLARLKQLGRKPLLGGVIQVVSTVVLGALITRLFGLTFRESIAFGAMISLSSTAVVLRILMERSEMEMPHGQNSLAVLLVQDMAVVPLALLMAILAGGGGAEDVMFEVGKLLIMAGVLVVGLLLLNQIAIRSLGTLTLHRNRELTVLFAVVTGLGSAWAAHAAGISPALGAFVAGMLLGSSAFATQIRADISSLRVVLLTLFFGSAGMVADPIWILKNWYIVAGVAALLTVGKLAVIWLIFQFLLGHTARVASATGLCLAQIGEFAFVLGSIGRANGVVSEELYALVVSVTIVSFFLSALFVPRAPRFGNYIASLLSKQPAPADQVPASESPPEVIVIGYGPAGQIASQPFIDRDVRVLVIDLNQDGARRAEQNGFQGEVGDATQSDVLEHAQLMHCEVVVITVPHFDSAMAILQHVRQHAPHVRTIVRSRYQRHTAEFVSAGAHVVVGDEEQVGEHLADELQNWLGTRDSKQPSH